MLLRALLFATQLLLSSLYAASEVKQDKQIEQSHAGLTEAQAVFLKQHWNRPIPPQGKPPASYSPLERSLHPAQCGTCHVQQYKDWQSSLHSKAMGPGLLGQLQEMTDSDPYQAQMCRTCHTPLAEQQDSVYSYSAEAWQENPVFDPSLQKEGLVCAACHVRAHKRYGPEAHNKTNDSQLPHGGFIENKTFSKSEFCSSCHQFEPDDYALNGKLIENTYQEWLASDYAKQGVQCQDCHMPDRRHLWRGIHDQEMVKKAITMTVEFHQASYAAEQDISATITLTNTGAGHYLPTYLVPKLFIRARLLDDESHELADSMQEAVIGRETLDMMEELYDTRIPPGQSHSVTYQVPWQATADSLEVTLTVDPDHYYARFYETVLAQNGAGRGRAQFIKALENARNSPYEAFRQSISLKKKK